MKIQQYLSRLRRQLYVSEEEKNRILKPILDKIRTLQLAGCSQKEILAQLPPASEVAREANLKAGIQYRKSPWRWACLALTVVCVIWAALPWILPLFSGVFVPDAAGVGIIGGADGPTSILISSEGGNGSWMVWLLAAMGLVGFFSLRKCPVTPQKTAEE